MTVLGCTGHQSLTLHTQRLIASAITGLISENDSEEIIGLTSLAEGADQLFAFAILAGGGRIEAIIPSEGYEHAFPSEESRVKFQKLCNLAVSTKVLPFDQPSEEAFLAAGHQIVDECDILVAVWNGKEAVGTGGTGDIVRYAKELGIPVKIVWPNGSHRNADLE